MNPGILIKIVPAVLLLASTSLASTVYFGMSGTSKGIYVAEFDSVTGTLSAPRLAINIKNPGFLAIHPNKKYLYSTTANVGDGKNGGAAAMAINADKTLTLLNTQSSKGPGTCHVNIDHTGQCLMSANYGGGSVTSFQIKEDGSLTEAISHFEHEGSGSHPERQQKPYAHSIFTNPENTFAYACDLGIDKVMIYQLDAANGTLTPTDHAKVPGGSMGPRHMKWSSDGLLAYVLNELDMSISVYMPGKKSGSLKFIKSVSTLPKKTDKERMTCAEIRIHPNGRFLYASNRDLDKKGRDSISVFSRFEDGFQRLATIPAQVWIPRNFNIDPTGNWMLVGGQKSEDVAVFKIDTATGLLGYTGTNVPFEGGPICIEFLSDSSPAQDR